MMFASLWNLVYFTFVRPMYKWLFHKITGQCELLRITYKQPEGTLRSRAIESSLKHSKTHALKRLLVDDNVNIEEAVQNILKIKSISPEVHSRFIPTLQICLCQICGYRQLITEVESIRKTPYSSENIQHEEILMQLWSKLKPDIQLQSRITKQWTDIGFQGDDPQTDFRGMGLLGLQNLVFFATQYTETVRQVLSHSHHPQYGYSFAIVGINLTGMAYTLLTSGVLKTHFYNVVQGKPRVEHFHDVYCYLVFEFDKFWLSEKPKDIMEFNRVKDKFQKKVTHMLKDRTVSLRSTFAAKQYSYTSTL